MNDPLKNFNASQVANGWVLTIDPRMGCIGDRFVFASLVEMADWLRVQVERDAVGKAA